MKFLAWFAPLALAGALPVHATIDRTIEKTFTVSAAGTIVLETEGGSLQVVSGPDGAVRIVAREKIHARSEAEAESLLQDLDLNFEQTGDRVRASSKYRQRTGIFHRGSWPPVQVDFVATVPAAFAAELSTHGGGISVGDIAGAVHARTSGGSIKLGRIGGKVDAETSGGGISLEEARNAVKLSSSGGGIKVGRVAGPAELSTSGGGISIDAVEENVQAHTSGGGVRATIVGPLKSDCSLSTAGGSVHVSVDKSAAFHLDAATSGGSVHAEGLTIRLQGSSRQSKLAGDVNGGGPELKLRTSGGNVDIDVR
jgi:hypothetical protein